MTDGLFARLRSVAARYPDRLAIRDATEALTYRQLVQGMDRVAGCLPSRPLVCFIAVPGGVGFTQLQLGLMQGGSVAVPVPSEATAHEWEVYAQALPPDRIIVGSAEAAERASGVGCPVDLAEDWLSGAVRPDPGGSPLQDLAMVQFTSGSTGVPKALAVRMEHIEANFRQSRAFLEVRAEREVLLAVPQFHAMGNAVVLEHLWVGSTVHVLERFSPGVHLRRLQEASIPLIAASPNYFSMLGPSLSPKRAPGLKEVLMGSAAVTPPVVQAVRKGRAEVEVHVRYGQSESVGTLLHLELGSGTQLSEAGEVGRPLPGVEIGEPVPGDGGDEPVELRVRADSVVAGRIMDGGVQPITEDAWLGTGDLVVRRHNGTYLVRGRRSEFLKCNGHRINPFELEAWLSECPGAGPAAVIGVDDPVMGQKVVAVVETDLDVKSLRAHCQAGLSPVKVPQIFIPVASLPRNAAGKPDRRAVKALATDEIAKKKKPSGSRP